MYELLKLRALFVRLSDVSVTISTSSHSIAAIELLFGVSISLAFILVALCKLYDTVPKLFE